MYIWTLFNIYIITRSIHLLTQSINLS